MKVLYLSLLFLFGLFQAQTQKIIEIKAFPELIKSIRPLTLRPSNPYLYDFLISLDSTFYYSINNVNSWEQSPYPNSSVWAHLNTQNRSFIILPSYPPNNIQVINKLTNYYSDRGNWGEGKNNVKVLTSFPYLTLSTNFRLSLKDDVISIRHTHFLIFQGLIVDYSSSCLGIFSVLTVSWEKKGSTKQDSTFPWALVMPQTAFPPSLFPYCDSKEEKNLNDINLPHMITFLTQSTTTLFTHLTIQKVVVMGTYTNSAIAPIQPLVKIAPIPNTFDTTFTPFDQTEIKDISCYNCSYLAMFSYQSRLNSSLIIFFSSNRGLSVSDQIWKVDLLSKPQNMLPIKVSFQGDSTITHAVRGFGLGGLEVIYVSTKQKISILYLPDLIYKDPNEQKWIPIPMAPMNKGVTITSLITGSAITNKILPIETGSPCVIYGMSNGTIAAYYWIEANELAYLHIADNEFSITTMSFQNNITLNKVLLYYGNQKSLKAITNIAFMPITTEVHAGIDSYYVRNKTDGKAKVKIQEQNNWCWAAVLQGLTAYYEGKNVEQCHLVNIGILLFTTEENPNCCRRPVKEICTAFVPNTDQLLIMMTENSIPGLPHYATITSAQSIMNEIRNNRPVIAIQTLFVRFGRALGHTVLITGFQHSSYDGDDAFYIEFIDPNHGWIEYATLPAFSTNKQANGFLFSEAIFTSVKSK
jgi:hypothetical protein